MVRPLTQHVFECLMLDLWPRPAAIVDFGIKTPDHFAALQRGVKTDQITVEQLDDALGNGKKLTTLVNGEIQFRTSYDILEDAWEEQEQEEKQLEEHEQE